MNFSDRQLELARQALLEQQKFGTCFNGEKESWITIAADIGYFSDIEIGSEAIRRFAMGLPTHAGSRKPSTSTPHVRKAIYTYLTHPDVLLVTKEAFDDAGERSIDLVAAARLVGFLKQDSDQELIAPPESLLGQFFRSPRISGENVLIEELAFDRASDANVLGVRQTNHHYTIASTPCENEEMSLKFEREETYLGWGVLTPEDRLLIFLKNNKTGANLNYSLVASDLTHVEGTTTKELVFLKHNYPISSDELEGTRDLDSQISERLVNELFMVSRPIEGVGPNCSKQVNRKRLKFKGVRAPRSRDEGFTLRNALDQLLTLPARHIEGLKWFLERVGSDLMPSIR